MTEKHACLAALSVLLTMTSACFVDVNDPLRVSNTDHEVQEQFAMAFPIDNHSRFTLDAINGNVEITGAADTDSIRISGIRKVGSESEADAREHLADLQVKVDDLGNELVVQTDQPSNSRGRSYVINYQVILPRSQIVDVDNINGNIVVLNIDANVTADNTNGNVVAENISGNLSIDLTNGNVTAEVSLILGGVVDMDNVNGTIALRIPTSTSAQLSANVVNGNISTTNLQLQDMEQATRSLRARLGDGNGTIDLDTVNGGISLTGF